MAVIGYHFFPGRIKGGFVGVDIFFVISGFLIGGILLDSLYNKTFSLLDFYARRIRRIFPALILVMASALAFGWFALLPDDYQNLGKHSAGGAGFISNFMFWKEAGYFDVAAERKPLLHLWSLGIEEQFYIVFPLFLWLLWVKGLRATTFLFAFLFVSLVINLSVYKKHEAFDFYMPITRFWELSAGALLALAQRRTLPDCVSRGLLKLDAGLAIFFLERGTPRNDGRTLRHCLSVLGILILAVVVFKTKISHFPGKRALWPVLGSMCVIAAGFGQASVGWLNHRLLSWRPMVAVGLISYPLYLWHWPLISYARIILGEMPGRGFRIGLIAAAFALATLTYFCLERPIRFGKNARGAKAIGLLILLAVLGGAGGVVYFQKGIETRKNMEKYLPVSRALRSPVEMIENWDWNKQEKECWERFNLKANGSCQYYDAGGVSTTLVVGDSHAQYAFHSIAEYNARIHVNTLLLTDSGIDNIVNGNGISENTISAYKESVFGMLRNNQTIQKVFIFTRGIIYIDGKDNDGSLYHVKQGEENFLQRTQDFVDKLIEAGKDVFIVAENPVLPYHIRQVVLNQPLRPVKQVDPVYKSDVSKHQEKYINVLKSIKGATIIYTLGAFCPQETCLLFDENGLPLYVDDDHLSVYPGGRFLIERALKPYLTYN